MVDLQIEARKVSALVSGSDLYKVEVERFSDPEATMDGRLPRLRRRNRFAGRIAGGSVFKGHDGTAMPAENGIVSNAGGNEVQLFMSRFRPHVQTRCGGFVWRRRTPRRKPELLFKLRDVEQQDLVTNASRRMAKPSTAKLLDSENLSELFGIEIAELRNLSRREGWLHDQEKSSEALISSCRRGGVDPGIS